MKGENMKTLGKAFAVLWALCILAFIVLAKGWVR
ncbi:TPA_asm: hypothetical protein vir555_00033 [Caudoviricetes sp. vir555]|nr:TPA_asm: hypothetical protein vir555_00033 [Caudoviricetes sp. vir555]